MSGRKTRRQRREGRKKFDEVGKEPPLPIELTSHHWITVLNFRSTDGLIRMYTSLNPRALGVFTLLLCFVAYLYVQRCTALQRSKKLKAV